MGTDQDSLGFVGRADFPVHLAEAKRQLPSQLQFDLAVFGSWPRRPQYKFGLDMFDKSEESD